MAGELLAGVHAKLARAHEHMEALDDRWRAFVETQPYAGLHQHDFSLLEWDSYFVVERDIPVELSAIVGDVLHNLRSCLEHLVSCMVIHNGGTVGRHHAFPIYGDEPDFVRRVVNRRRENDRLGPLDGIPRDSGEWALIKRSQPYHLGDNWREHPLAILNEMSNIDKHRSLHVGAAFPDSASAIDLVTWEPEEAELIDSELHWQPGDPLEDQTHIVSLRFTPARPAAKVRMKTPIPVAIAFGDHSPERPRGDFNDVVEYVVGIVREAEVLLV